MSVRSIEQSDNRLLHPNVSNGLKMSYDEFFSPEFVIRISRSSSDPMDAFNGKLLNVALKKLLLKASCFDVKTQTLTGLK